MPNIQRDFVTLSQWVAFADNEHPNDGAPRTRSSCKFDKEFTGVATKEEAFNLLRNGYPEGLAKMREILELLNERIILPTTTDRFISDVSGCAPNIDAYIQGDPENMFVISQIETTAPPSLLTLQLELCFSAWITPNQAMWAGAVILAATQALAIQGCAVDILATFTTTKDNVWQTSFPVPRLCDMDTLSFILSHPAMLRVICFSMMEHEDEYTRQRQGFWDGGGYGRPTSLRNDSTHIDAEISMKFLTNALKFQYDGLPDMEAAATLFNKLVTTQFGTLQTQPNNQ